MASPFYTLAKEIYTKTQNQKWLGGSGTEVFPFNSNVVSGRNWQLSPEVKIGGMNLNLCVTWYYSNSYCIHVFVDGMIGAPGGTVENEDWWVFARPWHAELFAMVKINNGQTGYIKDPATFLKEIHKVKGSDPSRICSLCKAAMDEVDGVVPKELKSAKAK